VARDRQRAKQRRRRQPGGGGTAAGTPRQRPREPDAEPVEPVEPAERVEEPTNTVFPQRGDVEPVDIPEDAAADANLDQEAVEAAPDELDPAVTEEREERAHPRKDGKRRGGIITFLGHVVDELRRVQWPDRKHVGQGTAVVLGFVVIAGGYLGLMDAIWKPLIEAIL
jgi:preprotein translocase SecE subunit